MRTDGARFHMLLGREDWGRCTTDSAAGAVSLAALWDQNVGSPGLEPPGWDEYRHVLTLPPVLEMLPSTPGERPLDLVARRAAAADENGNVYWIGDDETRLFVRSAGTRRSSAFWPDARAWPSRSSAFRPAAAPAPARRRYTALAVTEDAWLTVAFVADDGAAGLEQFDLIGGGPPMTRLWQEPVTARDLAAGCCGGLWLLDRRQRLFRLDRRLDLVGQPAAEAEDDLFQPLSGEPRAHARTAPVAAIDLDALFPGIDAIAIAPLPGDVVAILSRIPGGGLIHLLMPDGGLAAPVPVDIGAHDIAVGDVRLRDDGDLRRLIVTGGNGNQALAFRIEGEGASIRLHPTREAFILRRYGGRALVVIGGAVHYDSGDAPRWTPVVERALPRFATAIAFRTPVFDADQPQTTWDRVKLDGCIPPGARIAVEARAADGADQLGEWLPQPGPILNPEGGEFAGLGPHAMPRTDRRQGRGTWDLLLQNLHGRYLQLRVTMMGDGVATPHLRALRVWYPRFSYSNRFLPAVYRSEPADADFLDRFLANMEGTNIAIERRIGDAQALFDPRTAPAEALEWLAEWFDVALDPAWDEPRRRLFIAHAATFFGLRGTLEGIRIALALAFDPCSDARLFNPELESRHGIRIVETYLTRRSGATVLGDPQGGGGPLAAGPGSRWSTAEGNAGLAERIARGLGRAADTAELAAPVPLFPPDGAAAPAWRTAIAAALGFQPSSGEGERQHWRQFQLDRGASPFLPDLPRDGIPAGHDARWAGFTALASGPRQLWQAFLAARYRTIEDLNRSHGAHWPAFEVVAVPDRLPTTTAAQRDWAQFEGRLLPMAGTAHRFSVLLPVTTLAADAATLAERAALARRIVEIEKPAHTVFDVRFYFAMNRIGEARLGLDTTLGQGSRAPELLPLAILGSAYLGESFIGPEGPPDTPDRRRLAC